MLFLTEIYHVKVLFIYVKYILLVDSVGISESITTGSTSGKGIFKYETMFQLLPNTTCTSEKGGPIQNQCVVTSVFRSTRGKSITVGMKIC